MEKVEGECERLRRLLEEIEKSEQALPDLMVSSAQAGAISNEILDISNAMTEKFDALRQVIGLLKDAEA